MKYRIFIITLFLVVIFKAQVTNFAPSIPITDDYFGIKIVDEYRNLENLQDPNTMNWMKSQTNYTNSILSKIPNRKYYVEKRLELDKRQGYLISNVRITGNDRYFYLKKKANEKVAQVYYREGFEGKEVLLYNPSDFISSFKNNTLNDEHTFVVNLLSPSWDGNKIVISMSEKGKELSEIIIMDVKTKFIHPEIITNTNPSNIGGINWLEDNSGFFYTYYPVTDLSSDLFNKNTQSILYKIGDTPKKLNDVFSKINNPNLKILEEVYPAVMAFNPDDKYYIGILVDSEGYRQTYIQKKEELLNGKNNWKSLYDKSSKVHFIRLEGEDLFFLSGYNSPNYKLCKTNVNNPDFKKPEILIPEKKDEVFKSYAITKDGIYYVTVKNGVEAKLYFYNNDIENSIKLPYVSGNINLQSKGGKSPDIWITCSGWANQEQRYKYNLQTKTFHIENLAPIIEYPEFKDIIVEEVVVKSYDGTEVPLSLIYNKNLKRNGTNPVLIEGYGAYGESYYPFFARSYLLWANQGGVFAIAHVRGGGEKGEKWHIDGQKDKKPNSWKDLIACSEYLINQKYTSSKKIGIWGASAGGILVGRAMTERPDLFGAVIAEVGVLNALRNENGGVGKVSAKEFGSITNPNEFKGLLEMDAYQHIQKGEKYPAVLVTAGINDPRVTPWQPAKFIAKLLVNTISNSPVLLKVDYQGGHGGDIPLVQTYSNLSDIFAFAFWQLGHPDYQPKD